MNRTWNKKCFFVCISIIVLLLWITYSNSFKSSWHLDDYPHIVRNPKIHIDRIDLQSILNTFVSTESGKIYRPLPMMTFAMNWIVSGNQVYGYHTYYPNDGYSCVFKGKERPVYSPGYLALVDGNEDFTYLLKLRSVLKSLQDAGRQEGYYELSEELKTVVGWKNAILLLRTESANSQVYPVLKGSSRDLYEAKGKILEILARPINAHIDKLTYFPNEMLELMCFVL